jgi:hypothetical protein
MNRFDRVREICGGWGLYENSTEQTQILYAISEAGELAKSIAKNDREAAKDDIGDILVCLINAYELDGNKNKLEDQADFILFELSNIYLLAELLIDLSQSLFSASNYSSMCDNLASIADNFGLTIDECLDQAISQIEKRKGKIVNGVFCKE